jgi:subtilase family serine protease
VKARTRVGAGVVAASAAVLLAAAVTPAATGATLGAPAPGAKSVGTVTVRPLAAPMKKVSDFPYPPTTADCLASAGVACYAPAQYQRAYDMVPLYNAGLTGRGSTIVIVDAFGSPTIQHDLGVFDHAFGLAAPPKFDILQPAGKVPAYDSSTDRQGWAGETTLDVEWAHAMAPGANIVLVETPVTETEGVQGFPEIVKAENYVLDHGIGDVISQSFGATEQTFPSKQSLLDLRSAFVNAQAKRVPVLGSSGDAGATDSQTNGVDLYPYRVNSWPSSDPLVTSIGGTQLHLDSRGDRTAVDNVWNDEAKLGSPIAGGGGQSIIFGRPPFQNSVQNVVGSHRGTPDISLSAAVDGGALTYGSYGGEPAGWSIVGGTSEASPLFSGIVAIATQAAGHRLGTLNPRLYAIGSGGQGIPDITRGNNTVSFKQNGKTVTVQGFAAGKGYDLSSGLGTVDGLGLVASLAQ